jgi:protease-4
MVDALHFRDEVREGMCGKERTSARRYHAPPSPFSMGQRIVVLHAEGTIVGGESGQQVFGGSMIGDRTVVEQLDDLREDDDVKAIVLRVNSPGGSGGASDNIWRAITRVQDAGKPVVVSMGDYAASGGYYIAAPADWIVAEPSTLTGSIGVFGGKLNVAGLYDKLGITTYTYQRGQLSSLFSPTSDFSDAERATFRRFLENFYDLFLDRVAQGRNMDRSAVAEVAKGRVWTGTQAMEHKLVDAVGGLDVAIAKARELAAVGEDVSVERMPKRQTLWDQLAEDFQPSPDAASALPEPLVQAWSRAERLARVLDGSGVAAMLPYEIVSP